MTAEPWTPQNNRIQTMHLTADELAALKAAKWGWEIYDGYLKTWRNWPEPAWSGNAIIRAKPAPVTQDVVPWEAIDARYGWAARDAVGTIYFFAAEPFITADFWNVKGDDDWVRDEGLLANLTPGTCDWRDSLQQRPQPAATGAVTEPLPEGCLYFVPHPVANVWFFQSAWTGTPSDELRLERGLIYLTEADAVAAAKTMCAKGGV